jgi:hypothetical protein
MDVCATGESLIEQGDMRLGIGFALIRHHQEH